MTAGRLRPDAAPASVHVFVGLLFAAGFGLALFLEASFASPDDPPWVVLPALAGSLTAAEFFFARFRYGGQVNALNLMEAALAPLVFTFPGPVVMATVGLSQLAGGTLRRNAPVKVAFNVAQWTLAAGIGSWVFSALAAHGDLSRAAIVALVAALAAVGVTNQSAFTVVLALVNKEHPAKALRGLAPAIVPGWVIGWAINSFVGLLFVLAIAAHPAAAVLFPVPLALLHLAYFGYAGARSDRLRLAGLHRAAGLLAKHVDSRDAMPDFLREAAGCFEARAAMLVLLRNGSLVVHRHEASDGGYRTYELDAGSPSLERALSDRHEAGRWTARTQDDVGAFLARSGFRDCLAAPLIEKGTSMGALALLDQAGFEGFEAGELAVVEALARQTASILTTGALVRTVLEERRKLAEIVSSTSDGIFTVSTDGTVRNWNRAMESMTGVRADRVVNVPGGLQGVRFSMTDGSRVRFDGWADGSEPPESFLVNDGTRERRLSCSYGVASEEDGGARTLVVVARDVTPYVELRHLRRETRRLAAAEAAQRAIVEQLQEALTPPALSVPGLDLGVHYLPSEEASPTGGDAYDWQVLPSGEVHVAVIDVVGHGLSATKDALSVIHAFRVLAAESHPLEEMIERADALLASLGMSLAATVLLVRYDPSTGQAHIAAGGHPPALHIAPNGAVTQIAAPGGAVGWPGAGSLAIATVQLHEGDSLMLYTDGLVEAGKDILAGEETLIRHAHALAGRPAQELATAVVERILAECDRRDDTLALVLRRIPPVRVQRWRIFPEPRRAAQARRELVAWLGDRDVPATLIDDAEIVAGELLANATRAARTTIELSVGLSPNTVSIEVEDDGPAFDGRAPLVTAPPLDADAGRGLFLVRDVSEVLEFERLERGLKVRAILRAADPRSSIPPQQQRLPS